MFVLTEQDTIFSLEKTLKTTVLKNSLVSKYELREYRCMYFKIKSQYVSMSANFTKKESGYQTCDRVVRWQE